MDDIASIKMCSHILQQLQATDEGVLNINISNSIEEISLTNKNFKYQYLTAKVNGVLYVAFRGTKNVGEFITTNLNIICSYPRSSYKGGIHKGFYELSTTIPIHSIINELELETTDFVVLCGYSLGGAISQLVGINVMCKRPDLQNKVKIYTFGSPLVGNSFYSEYCQSNYNDNFYFILNYNDIVPKSLCHLGYKGFGKCILIKDGQFIRLTYKQLEQDNKYLEINGNISDQINLSVQVHSMDLYNYDIFRHHMGTNRLKKNQMTQSIGGISELKNIVNMYNLSANRIVIHVEGVHVDHICKLTCFTLPIQKLIIHNDTNLSIVCLNEHSAVHEITTITFKYHSIFGDPAQKISVFPCNFCTMSTSEIQERIMSKESLNIVIQRAIFNAKYSVIETDKKMYEKYLERIEYIAKDMPLSTKAQEIIKFSTSSSIDVDILYIANNIYIKYYTYDIQQLYDVLCNDQIRNADKEMVRAILSSKLYEEYSHHTNEKLQEIKVTPNMRKLRTHGDDVDNVETNIIECLLKEKSDTNDKSLINVSQKKFLNALHDETLNKDIINIYAATAESRIKILEYLAHTDVKKFMRKSMLDYAAIGAAIIGVGIATIAIIGLPVLGFLLWYFATVTGFIAGGTWLSILILMGLAINVLEYLTNIQKDYYNNLVHLSTIFNNYKSENNTIWSLEYSIYETLRLRGINIVTELDINSFFCDSISESSKNNFVQYVKAVYIIHELRKIEIGMFNVAVVGPTKVGKSKLLKQFGFNSKPGGNNTLVIGAYNLSDRCRIIDFPGFDDARTAVRKQFETNIQLANMFIVVLDAKRINNDSQYEFLIEMIMKKKDIPTIILCNCADLLVNVDDEDEHISVEEFSGKFDIIRNLIGNTEFHTCCLLIRVNSSEFNKYGIKRGHDVKNIIIDKLRSLNIHV